MNTATATVGESGLDELTSAQRQNLAERYIPFAKSLARAWAEVKPRLADEFYSAALFALAKAANDFDPSIRISFVRFAAMRIHNEIRLMLRNQIPLGYRTSSDEPPKIDSTTGSNIDRNCLRLHKGDDQEGVQEIDHMDFVENYLRKMPRKVAEAMRLVFVNDQSCNEASKYLGCGKSHMIRLRKRGLDIMRDEIPPGSYHRS